MQGPCGAADNAEVEGRACIKEEKKKARGKKNNV